jgi:hypothetical protein
MNYLLFNREFTIKFCYSRMVSKPIVDPPLELKSYLEIEVSNEEHPTEQTETLPPGNVPSDVEKTQTDRCTEGPTNTRGI